MRSTRRTLTGTIALTLITVTCLAAPTVAADSLERARAAGAVSPAVSVPRPNVIGFEADADGAKPGPFTSADNPTVHFVDTVGDDLRVADLTPQSNGKGLAAESDDASALEIRLDVPTRRISMAFGNDDPDFTQDGDRATLRAYRGDELLAIEHVAMDRDDAASQRIRYQGPVPANRVTLIYERAGTPLDLIELVDDIRLAQACQLKGSGGPNTLKGNDKANGICGFARPDRIAGGGGNDVLLGRRANDRLTGNAGNDLLKGGRGDDTLRTRDGVSGNDTAYGGPGHDTCIVDAGDTVYDCEVVQAAV